MSRNCQYRNEASFPAVSIQNKQDFKKNISRNKQAYGFLSDGF